MHYFNDFTEFYYAVQEAGSGLFDGHGVISDGFIFNCGSLYDKSIIMKESPIFIKYDCYDFASLKKIKENYEKDAQKKTELVKRTFFRDIDRYLFRDRICNANTSCGVIPYVRTKAKHIFYNGCVIKNKDGLKIERLYGRDHVFAAKFEQFIIYCIGSEYYVRFYKIDTGNLPLTKHGNFTFNGQSYNLCEREHITSLVKFNEDTLFYFKLKEPQ